MRISRNFLFTAGLLLTAWLLSFPHSLDAETLSGRDVVAKGTLKTLNGVLIERKGEWYLQTQQGEFEVHLGNYEVLYPRGISLAPKTQAEVHGFVYGKSVAPVWIKNQNRTYKFRDTDGTPLWSGSGNGRNQNLSGRGRN